MSDKAIFSRDPVSFPVRTPARVFAIFMLLSPWNALAQQADREPSAVIEIGPAASRSLTENQSSFGPTIALEFTPIENRLEVEAGVTALFRRHSTEWSTDFLFKKPWDLSNKIEFMVGAGPEWIHTNAYGNTTNAAGIEIAPELMFWHSAKHRVGWYIEPTYEYKFGAQAEQSIGVNGGLLIGIP
jgi:hypothetical protein